MVTAMLRVFICGEKYLLFVLSEFLWIDVLGVKKEVAQRSEPHRQSGLGERQQPFVLWCLVVAFEWSVRVMACKSSWR